MGRINQGCIDMLPVPVGMTIFGVSAFLLYAYCVEGRIDAFGSALAAIAGGMIGAIGGYVVKWIGENKMG